MEGQQVFCSVREEHHQNAGEGAAGSQAPVPGIWHQKEGRFGTYDAYFVVMTIKNGYPSFEMDVSEKKAGT
jgi:hypothetical protein